MTTIARALQRTCVHAALLGAFLLAADARAELSGLASISTGSEHTCAITAGGGVRCWGRGVDGQVGDGLRGGFHWGRWLPVTPQGLASGMAAVAAGSAHTCALTTAGTVKCWGDNTYGQLGNGEFGYATGTASPVDVAGLSGVAAIAAGGGFTCALTNGGGVKCWGDNFDGQLGNGTTTRSTSPVDVSGLASGVVAISAGGLHACALTSGGAVKCWGYGSSGRLGDGAESNRTTPVDVTGLTSGVAGISAGSEHTCAVTTGGAAKCWGNNRFNQLGDGADLSIVANRKRLTPVDVVGLSSGVAAIAAGFQHSCVRMAAGTVKCWGANDFDGAVGTGTLKVDGSWTRIPTPADLPALTGVTAIDAGGYHACVLIAGGKARCWGRNREGQLGGGLARGAQPAPTVGVPDYLVAAGIGHTLVVNASGEVWGWGDNTAGKLGNGTTTGSTIPVRAAGLVNVVGASAGMAHSLAVKADGTVWAWGLNKDGQLGIGATSPATCVVKVPSGDASVPCALVPVQVPGLADIVAVSAGWRHSLALAKDGTVWRWGNDNDGGIGDSSSTFAPEQVPSIAFIVRISAGYMHSVAMQYSGPVWTWGRAERGELGNSTASTTSSPVQVQYFGADDIAAGGGFTLARNETSLYAWGSNNYGTLGVDATGCDADPDFCRTPRAVEGLGPVAAFTAGFASSIARRQDGAARSWGLNHRGQLGHALVPDLCGTSANRPCARAPTAAPALDGALVLAAGGAHGLVVRPDDSILAFGDNLAGQLGNRSGEFLQRVFTQIEYDPDFTLTPGGDFGSQTGVGGSNTSGTIDASKMGGVAFGAFPVGTSSGAGEVLLSNLSNADVDVTSVTASGDAVGGEFSISSQSCTGTLAAGASCPIFLVFSPAAPGTRTGTLTILSNATNAPTMSFALTGTGVDPRVASTVSLAATAATSTAGSAVTFTATVNAGATTPTGTVAFRDGGATISGCASVAVSASAAACTTSALAVGAHSIVADYSGSSAVLPSSSAPLAHTVTAAPPPGGVALTVTKSGVGSGTVTSNPAGISCGATCSFDFPAGSSVTLTAAAAGGSVFTGWSGGGCSGTGTCVVTVSDATTVTATFVTQAGALALAANPASVGFGGQSMGTTSPAQAVTVTNVGNGPVTVSGVSATNAQFAQTNNCTTLAVGASCTVYVSFSPAVSAGALLSTVAANANLAVASNAAVSPTNVALSGTAEKSLVTHYYRAILNRAPDAAGKAFWEGEAARLAGLGVDVNETWYVMAGYFYNSAEYLGYGKNDTQFVTDLYNTFFNRGPDAGGLAYWTGQIAGGVPREVVLFSFMFSPEFRTFNQAIFGDTSARAEVNVVIDFFRGILNRLPDTASFNYWLGRMRTAQCAGAGAVYAEVNNSSYNFIFSAEYAGRNRNNTQFVTDMYYSFLRRGGDAGGVQYWINELNTGARTIANVRDAFIASPEFNTRVNAIVAQGCLP